MGFLYVTFGPPVIILRRKLRVVRSVSAKHKSKWVNYLLTYSQRVYFLNVVAIDLFKNECSIRFNLF